MTALSLIRAALVVVAATLPAGCATSAHFVRGTVVTADPTGVTVRHKSGQIVHASVAPSTAYVWDHQAASLQDLVPGARVIVILEQARGPFSAKEIRVLSRPKRTGQSTRAGSSALR